MVPVASPPAPLRFKVVRCIGYFDESGRFLSPTLGQHDEQCVIGFLVVSDSPEERDAVARLAADMRTRHEAHHGGARYDASGLDGPDLEAIADVLRSHQQEWKLGHVQLPLTPEDPATFREMMQAYTTLLRDKARDLDGAGTLDVRPHFSAARIDALSNANRAYLTLWFTALRQTFVAFRAWGILPIMRAVIDRRPGMQHEDVLNVVGRMAQSATFPEVYGGRLGELLGVRRTVGFEAKIRGDEGTPGLLVADLIAHARGRVARKQDPSMYGRFLARMEPNFEPEA